ncbi:MAG TPA: response regulator transcription factor [Cyclobacteriaceae bacterium]|nr:response regulator transcription factor [Cyclobacteriaceae bacterium]
MKTRLFIVDDHYMVIEGIRSLLENETGIEWLRHATDADSCLRFLASEEADVILMDVSLPDRNGTDLCKEVKQKFPRVRVLGLSTFN